MRIWCTTRRYTSISSSTIKGKSISIRTEGCEYGVWETLCLGTGFVAKASSGYHIVTCGHVVQPKLFSSIYPQLCDSKYDSNNIRVVIETVDCSGNVIYSAKALKQIHLSSDDYNDLAILHTTPKDMRFLLNNVQAMRIETDLSKLNKNDIVQSESCFVVNNNIINREGNLLSEIINQSDGSYNEESKILRLQYKGLLINIDSDIIACDFGRVIRTANSGSPLFSSNSIIGMLLRIGHKNRPAPNVFAREMTILENYDGGEQLQFYLPGSRIASLIKMIEKS